MFFKKFHAFGWWRICFLIRSILFVPIRKQFKVAIWRCGFGHQKASNNKNKTTKSTSEDAMHDICLRLVVVKHLFLEYQLLILVHLVFVFAAQTGSWTAWTLTGPTCCCRGYTLLIYCSLYPSHTVYFVRSQCWTTSLFLPPLFLQQ